MTAPPAATARTWARRLVRRAPTVEDPLTLVGSVAARVAEASALDPGALGLRPGGRRDDLERWLEGAGAPPGGWADPWLLGTVHEQAVSAADRRARGAWYTPEAVVRGVVALATPDDVPPEAVIDPTCGGGAFLLAALDRLIDLGLAPADAIGRVAGLDLDPGAVAVTGWAIRLWAGRHGLDPAGVERRVWVDDALTVAADRWPTERLVVGNPPFATPLRAGALPDAAMTFRLERADLLGPYADLAVIHLLRAVETCGPRSTVAMIQPQSILAGRDAAGLRHHLDAGGAAPLHGLWANRRPVFDAGVRACAVVLRPGSDRPARVALASGPDVARCGWSAPTGWSGLAAVALGRPALPPALAATASADAAVPADHAALPADHAAVPTDHATDPAGEPTGKADRRCAPAPTPPGARPADRLGALIDATAGFRDEHYGLVAACRESTAGGASSNRLTTVGMVEPLASRWGRPGLRFGGRRWTAPVIDLDALDGKVARWTERQLRPKVVLATQSPILEPLVDPDGTVVPATPLIAVHGRPEDLGSIAAVLLAPPVVAWAWTRSLGTAMTVDAVKLAASQVGQLPLPTDRRAWTRAAELTVAPPGGWSIEEGLARAIEVAAVMNEAYRAGADVRHWWTERTLAARGRRKDERPSGAAR